MSLLMDALKRAELAKQQGRGDPASGLAMEAGTAPEQGAKLPDLPKLEDLDDEFIAHANGPADQPPATEPGRSSAMPGRPGAAPSRPAGSAAGAAADRDVVRNSFAAKAGMGGERKGVLIVAGLGMLAVGIAGAYLWLQLKPAAAPVAARPTTGLATVRPAPAPSPYPETSAQAVRTDPPPRSTEQPPQVSPPRNTDPLSPISRRAETAPVTRRAPALAAGESAIRVTSAPQGVDPAIDEGYRLLLAGDLARARAAYGRVLRSEPRNADALHGIAAIALREGRAEEAAIAFQRILESNPADSAAQAGVIGLNGQSDAIAGESRIKSLIASQGDLPVLNFALGNLYARQQRWNDAQQAYFKAVTGEGDNPDYLFNLAVSLDQLHQPRLAAQYYGQALTAAAGHSAAFDRRQAEQRLRELQP